MNDELKILEKDDSDHPLNTIEIVTTTIDFYSYEKVVKEFNNICGLESLK